MSPPIHASPQHSIRARRTLLHASEFLDRLRCCEHPYGGATTIANLCRRRSHAVIKDLRVAETVNQLPQVPVQIVPSRFGEHRHAGQDEWDLDTQMSTGMAGTVRKLLIYDTTSLTIRRGSEFNKFAHQNTAKAGSASFGLCEAFAFLDGSMLVDDEVFLEAAGARQTVFASTGDNGSACPVGAAANGVPLSGAPGTVLYPASSPYVVAVGGTTLFTNSDFTYTPKLVGSQAEAVQAHSKFLRSGNRPFSLRRALSEKVCRTFPWMLTSRAAL